MLFRSMNKSQIIDDPAYENVYRPITFRAFKLTDNSFNNGMTVAALEDEFRKKEEEIYVERVKIGDKIQDPNPDMMLNIGDAIVVSGRRSFVIDDESWIGKEIDDAKLLSFPAENISVLLNKKSVHNKTIEELISQPYMHGVMIKHIMRGEVEIPIMRQVQVYQGDRLEIVGLPMDIKAAIPHLGYIDKPTNKTDFTYVSLGIVIGGIIGSLTLKLGQVPISLSSSGGALILGLILGWLRTKRPSYGQVPNAALWIMNNVGLNMFIAIVGITTGPKFISGLKEVGFLMFLAGVIST